MNTASGASSKLWSLFMPERLAFRKRFREILSAARNTATAEATRCALLLVLVSCAGAQTQFDLLLKGGHVIDARNGVSAIRDVAIAQGKIAAVEQNIAPSRA